MALQPPDDNDPFDFSGSVGRNGDNDRADVIKAQILLANAGHYALPSPGVPTGWPGSELDRAVLAFQRDNGLTPDSLLLPMEQGGVDDTGAGETLDALRTALGRQIGGYRAPRPAEVDRFYADPVLRNGDMPSTDIVTAERHRQTGEPVGFNRQSDVRRDIDPETAPPQPGQQEALLPAALLPLAVRAAPLLIPPAIAAGEWARQQYEKSRAGDAATPREAISDRDKAQMQTPPLQPPQVDATLQGRPADEPDPEIEQLIPPEMKPWIEGLEPFDQALARELLIVFNKKTGGRRGGEATRTGNAELVKAIMDDLRQHRPEIGAYAKHTRGARRPDKSSEPGYVEVPEEYIEGRDSGGTAGATWPDITVKYARQLASGMVEEYLRVFSGQPLKSDPTTGVKSERDQIARSEYNSPGHLNVFAPKLRPDQAQGQVSTEKLEQYRQTARELAERLGLQWEQHLKDKGSL